MTPDKTIEAAQEALARNDRNYASELYEVAARSLSEVDCEQAADLFKLASMYADENFARQDELAAEAQHLLESIGERDEQVADVLLGRGRSAEQAGHAGRAFRYYVECIAILARILSQSADEYLAHGSVGTGGGFGSAAQLISDKLRYCAMRLGDLEEV